ncbi:MAG TPA: GTP-binding protein [Parafilimonas sp.]|nr:GTP-binding protein [Parafilimonas sp.]
MKLILTGGFLGSGKTTAIQHACNLLSKQNKTVAVITNDQGEQLVDSKFIQSSFVPVKEVTKGCFCCNYNALLQNIYYFAKEINPEIIFAESVGSCTDLVATISKPLAEMHPELTVNISVFADAYFLYSIINRTASFLDDSVRYIFKKQMEEADILILNKIDLLNEEQLKKVKQIIQQDYSSKKILLQNSLNDTNVQQWLNCLNEQNVAERKSLDIDYKIYGEGEAKLAWLDAVVQVKTKKLAALKAAVLFTEIMYQKIKELELAIGHLKYLIDDSEQFYKISYTTASIQQQNLSFNSTSFNASVIINARVQTEPEILEQIFNEAIEEAALQSNSKIQIQSLSSFKPDFPKPTYRNAIN